MNVKLVESGGERPSVVAIDETEHLVAGAYFHRNYWRFYVAETWTAAVGIPFRPDPVHAMTKDQAVHWVEMLAAAYRAASGRAAA